MQNAIELRFPYTFRNYADFFLIPDSKFKSGAMKNKR